MVLGKLLEQDDYNLGYDAAKGLFLYNYNYNHKKH
jgi:hypothetical protein